MQSLIEKITNRTAHISVIGLGYVGLPLAVAFARAGYRVTGIDADGDRVAAINAGQCPVQDVDPDALRPVVESGHFSATTDFAILKEIDAISICVPTPLRKTKDPDISYILSV